MSNKALSYLPVSRITAVIQVDRDVGIWIIQNQHIITFHVFLINPCVFGTFFFKVILFHTLQVLLVIPRSWKQWSAQKQQEMLQCRMHTCRTACFLPNAFSCFSCTLCRCPSFKYAIRTAVITNGIYQLDSAFRTHLPMVLIVKCVFRAFGMHMSPR